MALSARKLQELMKEKRRREKLPPRPVVAELIPLTLKPRELNQITQRCSSLLLSIETTLVQCARDESMVDDEIVRQGLVCSIRHLPSESEAVAFIVSRLAATGIELNVNEEDWALALRGICTSVTNHCKGKTGAFSYLTTARAFVAKANGFRS